MDLGYENELIIKWGIVQTSGNTCRNIRWIRG